MPLPAFLLRCLLALALVTGGVPTVGMAGAMPHEQGSGGMTSCHDLQAPTDHAVNPSSADSSCCGSASCLCDCLQHMPAVALAVRPAAAPAFSAGPAASRSLQRNGHVPPLSLRPPIA